MTRTSAAVCALGLGLALVGGPGCGGAEEASAPDDASASYAQIQTTIFEPACTFACHSGGEFAAGGLDMQSPPRQALVDVPATASVCADAGWKRVVPGRPDESLLYLKIAAKLDDTDSPCGDGMPAGANRPALSAEEVERIRAWIEAGALED